MLMISLYKLVLLCSLLLQGQTDNKVLRGRLVECFPDSTHAEFLLIGRFSG